MMMKKTCFGVGLLGLSLLATDHASAQLRRPAVRRETRRDAAAEVRTQQNGDVQAGVQAGRDGVAVDGEVRTQGRVNTRQPADANVRGDVQGDVNAGNRTLRPTPDNADFGVQRSSIVMGAPVRLQNGETLGKIEELVISNGGCIEYLVVSQGNQLVAIPWGVAQYNTQDRVFLVDLPADRVDQIPTFNEYNVFQDDQYVNRLNSFYGIGAAVGAGVRAGLNGNAAGNLRPNQNGVNAGANIRTDADAGTRTNANPNSGTRTRTEASGDLKVNTPGANTDVKAGVQGDANVKPGANTDAKASGDVKVNAPGANADVKADANVDSNKPQAAPQTDAGAAAGAAADAAAGAAADAGANVDANVDANVNAPKVNVNP